MARITPTKKKKSSRTDELSRLKTELKRVTEQLESRDRELADSLEQQTATSEVLRVIATSPTDLQSVLENIAENATRVCGADDALIFRVEGDLLRLMAHYGPIPSAHDVGEADTMDGDGMITARGGGTGDNPCP